MNSEVSAVPSYIQSQTKDAPVCKIVKAKKDLKSPAIYLTVNMYCGTFQFNQILIPDLNIMPIFAPKIWIPNDPNIKPKPNVSLTFNMSQFDEGMQWLFGRLYDDLKLSVNTFDDKLIPGLKRSLNQASNNIKYPISKIGPDGTERSDPTVTFIVDFSQFGQNYPIASLRGQTQSTVLDFDDFTVLNGKKIYSEIKINKDNIEEVLRNAAVRRMHIAFKQITLVSGTIYVKFLIRYLHISKQENRTASIGKNIILGPQSSLDTVEDDTVIE